MIKGSELRRNNLILYLNELYVVTGIKEEGAERRVRVYFKTINNDINNAKLLNFITPIPLTPEILEKCGFVVVKSGWYKKNYFTDCNEVAEEMQISYNIFTGRCGIGDADDDWGIAMLGKTFTSLHQLQNLYFALTGEELTINL